VYNALTLFEATIMLVMNNHAGCDNLEAGEGVLSIDYRCEDRKKVGE
jgi:hypothetical protein